MNAKYIGFLMLLIGFCGPLKAQLSESFRVHSSTGQPTNIEANSNQAISCNAADLLMELSCYREAADMYSKLIDQFKMQDDTVNLDRACTGLYRAKLLANSSAKYTESLAKCRPEIIDSLIGKVNLDPMFINAPTFEPDISWLNSAKPGAIYKVTVQFDIDEYGNADNFDFNANDKFLLSYPIIEKLKNTRYLPAIENGKAVKKSKNMVEVIFCLDRGYSCDKEN
jgi:hypothetical protein